MVRTIVKIEGMACGMCESHMNDTLKNTFNVKKVSSSHAKKESVVISEEELDEAEVKKAVEGAGYTFVSMSGAPYEKKGFFSFKK